MEARILTLFTRTPMHVGAGNSVGAVDAPIMRERHTRIPIVPGSSLKGVLRDLWQGAAVAGERVWLFGNEQGTTGQEDFRAGALLIGEARVLCFPVRSAKGGFAWVTCPLALARYKRDAGLSFAAPVSLGEAECLAGKGVQFASEKKVVLEEYAFAVKAGVPDDVAKALAGLGGDDVWADVAERLVVLSDELFTYFVEQACEVVTRVRIDDETGTVAPGALFNQEQVPSETLFYAVIAAQDEKGRGLTERRPAAAALARLAAALEAPSNVVQVGGDETTGLGWCSVTVGGKEA